jgi:hypothetical protein
MFRAIKIITTNSQKIFLNNFQSSLLICASRVRKIVFTRISIPKMTEAKFQFLLSKLNLLMTVNLQQYKFKNLKHSCQIRGQVTAALHA